MVTCVFGKMTKRKYDGDDIKKLQLKLKTFRFDKEVRKQCDGGPCKLLRKTKTFNNPLKKKYSRFEPKKLRHYQVQYIIEKKYLPVGKNWVLSHRCHNKLCVNVKHIECERDFMNSSRNGCKSVLSKVKKMKNQILRCAKHKPCCFMWVVWSSEKFTQNHMYRIWWFYSTVARTFVFALIVCLVSFDRILLYIRNISCFIIRKQNDVAFNIELCLWTLSMFNALGFLFLFKSAWYSAPRDMVWKWYLRIFLYPFVINL